MKSYIGTIIQESLIDKEILNHLEVVKKINTAHWSLYTVKVSESEIEKLGSNLDAGKWYMHFWHDRDVIVVFQNKIFRFNYDNKKEWLPVIEYGLSLGIPKEQLDFPIE